MNHKAFRSFLRLRSGNRSCSGRLVIAFLLAGWLQVANAQQTGSVRHIGFLDPSTASGMAVLVEAFRQELNELGWVEGTNIAVHYRFAGGKNSRLPGLAADLVQLDVDLIVATSTPPTVAAKRATTTIPIVMTNVGDPVGAGLVASLARPGGNVTGLSGLSTGLNTKRLEILKDAVPGLARVGVLHPPGASVGLKLQLKDLRASAVALKLTLEEIETRLDAKGLENAFEAARQKGVGAIMTTAARRLFAKRKRLVQLAGQYRFPAIYPDPEFVDEGGLMSYGADYTDLFRRAAHYVDKILRGMKPMDLPVQQATKFEFAINLDAAKQIGINLPFELLARAHRVIK